MSDFAIVAIASSAGALTAIRAIAESLPSGCNAAIAIASHIGRQEGHLAEILNWHGKLRADFGRDGESFVAGRIYVAPPDCHMVVQHPGVIKLDDGALLHGTRPAADPLFESVGRLYGPRVVGVVLSGAGEDGAAGLRYIQSQGGLALVHDPHEAPVPAMPSAAIAADHPKVLTTADLVSRVARFCLAFPSRRS